MSHKRTRLARELSKKSGMSHQAALNAQPQMIKCPRSDTQQTFSIRCKSCRRWIWSGPDERKGACACGQAYHVKFTTDRSGIDEGRLVPGLRCVDCGAEYRLTSPSAGYNPWRALNAGQSQCNRCASAKSPAEPSEAEATLPANDVPTDVGDRILIEQRLRDSTAIISTGLKSLLGRVWPGLRIDYSPAGLFGGNDPTPASARVMASHFLDAHVPTVGGTTKVKIEVRTGERRPGTSTFRCWAWVGDRKYPAHDRRVDLISTADVDEFLGDILEAIEAHVPNSRPIVPGQQLRFAVENQWYRLRSEGSTVTIQAPTLRVQDLRVGPSGEVPLLKTLPVILGTARQVDGGGAPVVCRLYEGPLYVDDTDESWADATGGGLVPWLRAELGKHCIHVELLGPRKQNAVNVRAYFRVPEAA